MLIAQISDTHIKSRGRLAYGHVDTATLLKRCVAELVQLDPPPDLVVATGDLADGGLPEEYAHLRKLLALLRQPLVVIPGNHDSRDALRAAFAADGYLPESGFLHFALEDRFPLRVVGLDTVVPLKSSGALCTERLDWLERTLARRPEQPTVVLMHHPPFLTGIEHMDAIGLTGRQAFEAVVVRHPQIELILCGHLHRNVQTCVGGRRVLTAPSTAHQVALDLRPNGPSRLRLEPPGYLLHVWREWRLVTHHAVIGDYAGPYPFFDDDGRLID
ncbi:MAG: phosphodiesterase [Candidatus Competibacter denitrificans]|jgi:Icc protein